MWVEYVLILGDLCRIVFHSYRGRFTTPAAVRGSMSAAAPSILHELSTGRSAQDVANLSRFKPALPARAGCSCGAITTRGSAHPVPLAVERLYSLHSPNAILAQIGLSSLCFRTARIRSQLSEALLTSWSLS